MGSYALGWPSSRCSLRWHTPLLSPHQGKVRAVRMLGAVWGYGVVTLGLCRVAEWPLAVVDAGQSMAPDARRTWLEEQSHILKQTFW